MPGRLNLLLGSACSLRCCPPAPPFCCLICPSFSLVVVSRILSMFFRLFFCSLFLVVIVRCQNRKSTCCANGLCRLSCIAFARSFARSCFLRLIPRSIVFQRPASLRVTELSSPISRTASFAWYITTSFPSFVVHSLVS